MTDGMDGVFCHSDINRCQTCQSGLCKAASEGEYCGGNGGANCKKCIGGYCSDLENCRVDSDNCGRCELDETWAGGCVAGCRSCQKCDLGVIDPKTMIAGVCVDKCTPQYGEYCKQCLVTPDNPDGVCYSICFDCVHCDNIYDSCVDDCPGRTDSCYCGFAGCQPCIETEVCSVDIGVPSCEEDIVA